MPQVSFSKNHKVFFNPVQITHGCCFYTQINHDKRKTSSLFTTDIERYLIFNAHAVNHGGYIRALSLSNIQLIILIASCINYSFRRRGQNSGSKNAPLTLY